MTNLFLHLKLGKNLTLHPILSEHGENLGKLDLLGFAMEKGKDSTMLKMLKRFLGQINNLVLLRKLFVMQEFLQTIKKRILLDKLNYFGKLFLKRKSSQTSVLALILKEKDLQPFWTKSTLEMSQKLWLPTRTDCVDLDLNSSNGFLKNQTQNSWFSIRLQVRKDLKDLLDQTNSQKIYLQSQLSLSQETMGIDLQNTENKEKTKKKKNNKSRKNRKTKKNKNKKNSEDLLASIKLRIYPDPEQKLILNRWFGTSRFIYNKSLNYIKEEFNKKQRKSSDILNIKDLRSKLINDSNYTNENKWLLEIPYDVKDESLRDLVKNYSSNFAKKTSFQIRHKKRKDGNSLNVLSKHWNKKSGMYSKIFTNNLRCERKLPVNLDYTSRIIRDDLGNYFICIPSLRKKEEKENKETVLSYDNQVNKTTSIDPGVRTPLTCFDPTGKIIKFGSNDLAHLFRLFHYKNKLQSLITKTKNHSQRYKYKKALIRLTQKINNLVQDSHRKISLWLCQNYNTIIIPKLNFHNFKQMSKKNRTKMSLWSHCAFVDRLVDKSKEFLNCKVIIVQEDFTSKTCGNCGFIKKDLGKAETFNCDKCSLCIDRDTNGSRNIFLKYLTEHQSFQILENL